MLTAACGGWLLHLIRVDTPLAEYTERFDNHLQNTASKRK